MDNEEDPISPREHEFVRTWRVSPSRETSRVTNVTEPPGSRVLAMPDRDSDMTPDSRETAEKQNRM